MSVTGKLSQDILISSLNWVIEKQDANLLPWDEREQVDTDVIEKRSYSRDETSMGGGGGGGAASVERNCSIPSGDEMVMINVQSDIKCEYLA
jgi:hypothetical protein